jgi:sugar phosphate permease
VTLSRDREAATKASPRYPYVILAVGFLVVTGALGFGRFAYPMILPYMKSGLDLSYTQTGLLGTGNFVGYLFCALVGGFLAAKFGPRLLITVGLFLAGAAMVFTGLAPTFALAMAARVVTGMGSAASNVPMMGLFSAWFAPNRRGLASGIAVGGSGFGLVISGPLVPLIAGSAGSSGWRFTWYYIGGATLVIGILAYLFLRNSPAEKGLPVVGSSSATATGLPEIRSGDWRAVFTSPALWLLGVVFWLYGFAYSTYTIFFAAYLTQEAGLSSEMAGALWATIGVLSIGSGIIWGTVSDWLGRRAGLAIVFVLQALSFGLFALSGSTGAVFVSVALFGLTAWAIPAIISASAGDYAGPKLAPAALGLMTLFTGFGQAVGPSVGGYITDATSSFSWAFLVSAGGAFLGIIVSLLLQPPSKA